MNVLASQRALAALGPKFQVCQPHFCSWLCLGHLVLAVTSLASAGFLSNPQPPRWDDGWAFTWLASPFLSFPPSSLLNPAWRCLALADPAAETWFSFLLDLAP